MEDLTSVFNSFRVSGQAPPYNLVLTKHTGMGTMNNTKESCKLGKVNVHETTRE